MIKQCSIFRQAQQQNADEKIQRTVSCQRRHFGRNSHAHAGLYVRKHYRHVLMTILFFLNHASMETHDVIPLRYATVIDSILFPLSLIALAKNYIFFLLAIGSTYNTEAKRTIPLITFFTNSLSVYA
jgi:hypothetical protein